MEDKRRGEGYRCPRPVLLTEPVSQEPSGDIVPEDDEVITEPVPQEPPTDG